MFHFIQEITYNMLSEMNLLDMCVQESLRIYPPGQRSVIIQIVLSTMAINDNFICLWKYISLNAFIQKLMQHN